MSGWTVRLADRAVQDIEDILDWTLEQFGPLQLEAYTDVINNALEALNAGSQLIDVRMRPELGDNVATLHVARHGYKGRHQLVLLSTKLLAWSKYCVSCTTAWIWRDIWIRDVVQFGRTRHHRGCETTGHPLCLLSWSKPRFSLLTSK